MLLGDKAQCMLMGAMNWCIFMVKDTLIKESPLSNVWEVHLTETKHHLKSASLTGKGSE